MVFYNKNLLFILVPIKKRTNTLVFYRCDLFIFSCIMILSVNAFVEHILLLKYWEIVITQFFFHCLILVLWCICIKVTIKPHILYIPLFFFLVVKNYCVIFHSITLVYMCQHDKNPKWNNLALRMYSPVFCVWNLRLKKYVQGIVLIFTNLTKDYKAKNYFLD